MKEIPLNCITPIFNWLYNDEHTKRTIILIGSFAIATSIALCVLEVGSYSFLDKIGHFLLYTLVWAFQWGVIIPFILGLTLSILSFLRVLLLDLLR